MRLAAATMVVATPAIASAQIVAYGTASSPVVITGLRVDPAYAPGTIGGEAAEAPQFITKLDSGYIMLKFVNERNVPATTVKFLVSNGRYTHSIVDKGTFSQGVQIDHSFAVESGLSELENATSEVAEVDFADNTAWHIADADTAVAPLAPTSADRAPAPTLQSETTHQAGLSEADAQWRRLLFRNQGTSL